MANYTESQFQFPQAGYTGENSPRLPWNNTIFPGNYVAHLNAYRDQNVQAFPGVNFFRSVGAYVVPADATTVPASGTPYDLVILSPDLRQDDKPRLDRPFVLKGTMGGGGLTPYRVAINVVNLKGTGASTITTAPTSISGVDPVTLTADGTTELFPLGGEFTEFAGLDGTATAVDITVQATVGVGDLVKIEPSKEAAILVEVCWYANAPAPDSDDVHLPFPVESGQSSQ